MMSWLHEARARQPKPPRPSWEYVPAPRPSSSPQLDTPGRRLRAGHAIVPSPGRRRKDDGQAHDHLDPAGQARVGFLPTHPYLLSCGLGAASAHRSQEIARTGPASVPDRSKPGQGGNVPHCARRVRRIAQKDLPARSARQLRDEDVVTLVVGRGTPTWSAGRTRFRWSRRQVFPGWMPPGRNTEGTGKIQSVEKRSACCRNCSTDPVSFWLE